MIPKYTEKEFQQFNSLSTFFPLPLSKMHITAGTYDPEFRAMWMATVYNIDWPESASDAAVDQQAQMTEYLDMAQELNFNAIVFQGEEIYW